MDGTHFTRVALGMMLLLLTVVLHGCYAGTVGMILGISSLDDSGGSGNSPTVVSGVRVTDARRSPAAIHFVLTDRESDPAEVEIVFLTPGSSRPLPVLLTGDQELRELPTSPQGKPHVRLWDFERQLGDGSFREGLTVRVRSGSAVAEDDAARVGNDPPEVLSVQIPVANPETDEVSGIPNVGFTVKDSSDDVVSVEVEYAIVEDPELEWIPARPVSPSSGETGEGPAFQNVRASREGSSLVFSWDVFADLGRTENRVLLRFTPDDGHLGGDFLWSPEFRVDNNDPPAVAIDLSSFVQNVDRRWGIPIPFEVSDPESDNLLVVFQWRLSSQDECPTQDGFPCLPAERSAMEAILSDPKARQAHQIATELPLPFRGRLIPRGPRAARLPELAASAAPLVARGVKGRELEVLRHRNRVEVVGEGWNLARPVSALPVGDGMTALVLESPGAGSWRLRELDLATGREVRTLVAVGPGNPRAMTYELERESLLVAADDGDLWALHRVRLAPRDPQDDRASVVFRLAEAAAEKQKAFGGAVRGLASLGTHAALLTVESLLVRLDFPDDAPARPLRILGNLQTPWGIVLDPLHANRIYLAENGETDDPGGIIALELNTLKRIPLAAEFSRPEALALERFGARLLALTDADGDGTRELRAVELGVRGAEDFVIEDRLAGEVGSLAAGPDGLRLLALTPENRLAVAGGLEQRREILDYESTTQIATVDAPFEPPLEPLDRWRILYRSEGIFTASLAGTRGVFLWDSRDVLPGSEVLLRAVPFDRDRGVAASTVFPRSVAGLFREPPETLGESRTGIPFHNMAVADLNGDGGRDLITANYDQHGDVSLFLQEGPGDFGEDARLPVPCAGRERALPLSVDTGDLDLDGDQDLVVSDYNESDPKLVLFMNDAGAFTLACCTERLFRTCGPLVVDLNADGAMDLVSSNCGGRNMTLFLQTENTKGCPEFQKVPLESPLELNNSLGFAAGDLNGDGVLDLVHAFLVGTSSPGLEVFLQSTPEDFEVRTVEGSEVLGHWAVATADLDRDGDLDLVSAGSFASSVAVFEHTESGQFSLRQILGGSELPLLPFSVVAADFDRDGDLDLATANLEGDNLSLFFQRSGGEFPETPDVGLSEREFQIQNAGGWSLVADDLDGDGRLDLILSNPLGAKFSLYLQVPPGDFSTRESSVLRGPESRPRPSAMAAADLDGDGDEDVVAAHAHTDSLALFFQAGPGVFSGDPERIGHESLDQPVAVAAADLDGDGRVDVVSANRHSDNLTVFLQLGPGAFGPEPLVLGNPEDTNGCAHVTAADLNGDGRLDLVSANSESDSLTVFFQDGPGEFAAAPDRSLTSDALLGPVSVAAGDLDGDGDSDLISANRESDNVTLFFQDGPGDFVLSPAGPLVDGALNDPAAVAAEDLDGDSDLDLVVASTGSDYLVLFFQTAPRRFVSPPGGKLTDAALGEPAAVAAADLDGDGDVDLVSANQQSDTLTVFLQHGRGQFVLQRRGILAADPETLARPRSVIVADVDGDTNPDLVSANVWSENVTIFYGGH